MRAIGSATNLQTRVLSSRRSRVILIGFFALAILLGADLVSSAGRVGATDRQVNCRYGVGLPFWQHTDYLSSLGAGWFVNWGASTMLYPSEIEFVATVRVRQDRDEAGNYLSTYHTIPALTEDGVGTAVDELPGALWIVGSEPDRGPNPGEIWGGEDNTYPEMYATIYHDVYHFIKDRDPTAQIAVAGLIGATPGRLQYLDIVWKTYLEQYGVEMPVDVWNMHLYILPEAHPSGEANGIASVALGTDPALAIRESDPALGLERWTQCADDQIYCYAEHDDLTVFAEQLVAMRSWMRDHGQRDKPLIVTEYSLLYPFVDYDDPIKPTTCHVMDEYGECFTEDRVIHFLYDSVAYLESAVDPELGYPRDNDRLVQQWSWFSTMAPTPNVGTISDLLRPDGDTWVFRQLGRDFQSVVEAAPLTVNLLPEVIGVEPDSVRSIKRVTVDLVVDVVNNGSTTAVSPLEVTLYADKGLTQVIDSVQIESVAGCARQARQVTLRWPDLGRGSHRFWVLVDSLEAVAETDEGDNLQTGVVVVTPNKITLR